MAVINFAIVGGGWRSQFYLKVAQELPDNFHVSFVVEPDPERAEYIREKWHVETVTDVDRITGNYHTDFLVLCLPPSILPDMIKKTTDLGFYVLTETFAAQSPEDITELYKKVNNTDLVQISEQYWHQPANAARLNIINTGILGPISQAQVSMGHGYHGISLLRKYLGIRFENCSITGKEFKNRIVQGPGRNGYPETEKIIEDSQQFAIFDFGMKWGVLDFTEEQYFSRIRKSRVLLRGERGELMNNEIRYLLDHKTPIEYELCRVASGIDSSMEPPCMVGITAADKWYYKNPYGTARLSDDEISVAAILEKMGCYVNKGISFYSLAEGCQDQYLALMMQKSIKTGKIVETETQVWAK